MEKLIKNPQFIKWLENYSETNHRLNGWLSSDLYLDEVELPKELYLCLLQKWFREVHNIDVYVLPNIPNFKRSNPVYYVRYFQCPKKWELNTPKRIMESESVERRFDSPEQALEVGLLEALKLIKTDE